MAFGKPSKQDLIDAGLNPDEVNAALKSLKDGTATKEDLTKVTTALDAITESIKGLEGKLTKEPEKKTEEIKEDEVTDYERFTTDPTKYVKDEVGKLGSAAAVELKRISRNAAYRELSKSLVGFNNATLKAEIDAEWEKYPAELLARNNGDPEKLLIQLHDMVIGKHHNDIVQDRDKKDGKFNLVHSGSSANSSVTSSSSSGDKKTLTEQEQKMARKYGMTDEEWIKADEDMAAEEAARHKVGA